MWVDRDTSKVFAPDSILPSQYLGSARAPRPEHRLLLALLTDAWNTLDKYAHLESRRARHLVAEAWAWIEDGEGGGSFSYNVTCEYLGIDPEFLRKGIVRALEKKHIAVASIGVRRASPRQRIKVGA